MFLSGCICVCLCLHAAVEENPMPSQISRGPALQDRSPACLSFITLGPTLDHFIAPSVMAKATFTLWNSSFPCPSLESFVFYHLSRTTISPVTRTRTMEVLLNLFSHLSHRAVSSILSEGNLPPKYPYYSCAPSNPLPLPSSQPLTSSYLSISKLWTCFSQIPAGLGLIRGQRIRPHML